MSKKVYSCSRYPELVIAGICAFRDGLFMTDNATLQGKIEASDSFKNALVRVIVDEDELEAARDLPNKSAIMRMNKKDLCDLGKSFGLELNMDMTKNTLMEAVLALHEE
jgi:hypothetical protein